MEQILEFENGAIKSYGLSGMKGKIDHAIMSAGRAYYLCDDWKVEISNRKNGSFIIVKRLDAMTHKTTSNHAFKLRDGVLQIHYDDGLCSDYVKFHTGQTNDFLEEPFGITDVVIGNPNFHRAYVWNPQGQATGTIILNWLVTDGVHSVVNYGETDEETTERLRGTCGEITHVVEDATWTVVQSYEKHGTEIDNRITLYTENPNLFLMSKKLEDYLKASDKYARFEDIIEDFIVE